MKNRDKIIDEASSKFSINKQLVVKYVDKLDLICKGFFENKVIHKHKTSLSLRGNFETIDVPFDDIKVTEMLEYVLNNLYGINTYIRRGEHVYDDCVNPLYQNKEYYYQIVLLY